MYEHCGSHQSARDQGTHDAEWHCMKRVPKNPNRRRKPEKTAVCREDERRESMEQSLGAMYSVENG